MFQRDQSVSHLDVEIIFWFLGIKTNPAFSLWALIHPNIPTSIADSLHRSSLQRVIMSRLNLCLTMDRNQAPRQQRPFDVHKKSDCHLS